MQHSVHGAAIHHSRPFRFGYNELIKTARGEGASQGVPGMRAWNASALRFTFSLFWQLDQSQTCSLGQPALLNVQRSKIPHAARIGDSYMNEIEGAARV